MNIYETKDNSLEVLRKISDEEIIHSYNYLKKIGKISSSELNYQLAEKVFREFNDFNLKIIECGYFGHTFAPRSVLPYSRNYIICAYHIFLEHAKSQNDFKIFNLIKRIGVDTGYYPAFDEYKQNFDEKYIIYFDNKNIRNGQEESFKKMQNIFLEGQDKFKELCGFKEVSKEEYDKSTNSKDVAYDRLVYDFGISKDSELWKFYESDNKFSWFDQKNKA